MTIFVHMINNLAIYIPRHNTFNTTTTTTTTTKNRFVSGDIIYDFHKLKLVIMI